MTRIHLPIKGRLAQSVSCNKPFRPPKASIAIRIYLPPEYVEALKEKYPNKLLPQAVRKHIISTIEIKGEQK